MDERLLRLFDEEIRHLRETAADFGRAYPSRAGALALGQNPPDPYVERLLEGVAFMAARVRLKLDAQFPQFTQGLLETIYPDLLAPIPSLAIFKFRPDRTSPVPPEGVMVPRGSRVSGIPANEVPSKKAKVDHTPCVFVTSQDVRLIPVELREVQYLGRQVGEIGLDRELGARAALSFRLRKTVSAPWGAIAVDPLTVFALPKDGLGAEILENLICCQTGLVLRSGMPREAKVVFSKVGSAISTVAFDANAALLPRNPRTFEGFRYVREYFSLPERFQFFRMQGFQSALSNCDGDEIELIVTLREGQSRFERDVDASCFDLACSPAINLFSRTFSQAIEPSRFSEFHLVPDANRPLDYEVFSVESVEGVSDSAPEGKAFRPFFQRRHGDSEGEAFFSVNRQPRILSDSERRQGIDLPYLGSNVFLSLVDSAQVPYDGDIHHLMLSVICTNRHLPVRLREGRGLWKMEGGAKVEPTLMVGPTVPSYRQMDGNYAWLVMGAFSTNYMALVDDENSGASAIKEMLTLHSGQTSDWALRQINSLRRISSAPILRQLKSSREIAVPSIDAIGRGLEVTLEFEESEYVGQRLFVLSSVLEEFFARYVSMQSFTETVVRTWPDDRERMRWPARVGVRSMI